MDLIPLPLLFIFVQKEVYTTLVHIFSHYQHLIHALVQGIKFSSCLNSTICLPRLAKMVVGLRASTANIFIDNGPYREFIFKHFQVASVDEESAAVVLIS